MKRKTLENVNLIEIFCLDKIRKTESNKNNKGDFSSLEIRSLILLKNELAIYLYAECIFPHK